ncbi:hypothetical protein [Leptolyngbya sp. FACHB-261]|uniref:hypothetical protein n=1 Tax=Leptolyngbya sp. FACHB-261 TaxID=2692806 RepID=UPI0016820681|nr:hypothetical protein [Leptolyngbya sp. FACHB-261]MBD2103150.1 hypothetical protein [Leptolyngbya sp. FACHB-261]
MTAAPTAVIQIAKDYLQKEEGLVQVPEVVESNAAAWNTADLCQTPTPTEPGYAIRFKAEASTYQVHTNQDGSQIQICQAELDSLSSAAYTGPGYKVDYPVGWQVLDEGLAPGQLSRVRFLPGDAPADPSAASLFFLIERQAQAEPEAAAQATLTALKKTADSVQDVQLETPKADTKGPRVIQTLVLTQSGQSYRVRSVYVRGGSKSYRLTYQAPSNDQRFDEAFDQFVNSFAPISKP